ncbi:MAG: class I SAM-dependent methyltransferase [Bradyrhizobium sp.]|nr:MAG: class I SAM-dependent methyltransferase [Bradyrhizobium sp.]
MARAFHRHNAANLDVAFSVSYRFSPTEGFPVTTLAASELAKLANEDRFLLWIDVINWTEARTVLELGVWKGVFAQRILQNCPSVERYYMLDPWRHLDRWNKPANWSHDQFEEVYAEALARTDFAKDRRVILRGETTEVIDQIGDGELDLAYIDGDHTLKGISIDLVRTYPKVRAGGIVGGDDYSPTIWQHDPKFEPTLICPFAAYFAEAFGAALVVYPQNQFAIAKPANGGARDFRIVDTTGRYGEPLIGPQISRPLWAHHSKRVRRLVRPFSKAPFKG